MKKDLVKVIFGSHLYGSNDENSDLDYKIIYLPDLNNLLLGKAPKNYKERAIGPNDKMVAGEEECEYIPLHRLAFDFLEGQTYAYELVFAILNYPLTKKYHTELANIDETFYVFLEELASNFLTKDISKMVGYAAHQAQVYGVKGARLNAVEQLVAYLETQDQNIRLTNLPEIPSNLLNGYVKYAYITGTNQEYNNTLALQVNDRYYHLTETVGHIVMQLKKLIDKYGHRAKKAQEKEVDWKALSHAIRIAFQANEILTKHKLVFPLSIADYLRDVKAGKVPYDDAVADFERYNSMMEVQSSSLLEKTNKLRSKLEIWLVQWLKEFYNIKE